MPVFDYLSQMLLKGKSAVVLLKESYSTPLNLSYFKDLFCSFFFGKNIFSVLYFIFFLLGIINAVRSKNHIVLFLIPLFTVPFLLSYALKINSCIRFYIFLLPFVTLLVALGMKIITKGNLLLIILIILFRPYSLYDPVKMHNTFISYYGDYKSAANYILKNYKKNDIILNCSQIDLLYDEKPIVLSYYLTKIFKDISVEEIPNKTGNTTLWYLSYDLLDDSELKNHSSLFIDSFHPKIEKKFNGIYLYRQEIILSQKDKKEFIDKYNSYFNLRNKQK